MKSPICSSCRAGADSKDDDCYNVPAVVKVRGYLYEGDSGGRPYTAWLCDAHYEGLQIDPCKVLAWAPGEDPAGKALKP